MAFWNKGEDPWDRNPEKRREKREREPLKNPLDSLREWNEQRKREQEEQERQLAAEPLEKCPWCGKDMERGYLITGRGTIVWTPGRMTGRAAWIGPPREVLERRLRVDNEGGLVTHKTAWYCPDCEKMTIDAAGLQPPGSFWADGPADPFPEEETEKDDGKKGEDPS